MQIHFRETLPTMKTNTTFQGHAVWQMDNQQSQILLTPEQGARLLTWTMDGHPIIYWPDDADWDKLAHVRGGNPILFPFVARHMVEGVIGKWQDDSGKVYDLPMHGFARDMAYRVVDEADPHSLRMRLLSTPETWEMFPFEWQFDVVYKLGANTLEVTLETTNKGDAPLPYYAGHHFYFAVPHQARPQWSLSLPCERWGWQNPDGSVRFVPADKTEFTLDDPSLIDRFQLDFTSDQIVLTQQSQGQRITVDLLNQRQTRDTPQRESHSTVPWYDVTTWTQAPDSDFFCIEPWLGLPNAIHHGEGLRWLPAGYTESATCRIIVERA
ncbi:MAG: hypothetical protein JO316_24060 [Abitibacteriaceae bacterium]|nr:hypothetical protein [Abditibacteriaceae bacterium]